MTFLVPSLWMNLLSRVVHEPKTGLLARQGVVYTMDHVVVPRPCKIYDCLLNLSWDHFNLHQGKKIQSDHGNRGSLKDIF